MTKQEIIELLDELTARLEGPAEQVFEWSIRYNATWAVFGIIAGLTLIVSAIWLVRKGWGEATGETNYLGEEKRTGWWDKYDRVPATVGSGIVVIVGLFLVLGNIHSLLNIEYIAIKDLVPGL